MSNLKLSQIPEHCGLFNTLKNTFTQLSVQHSHNIKHYCFLSNHTNISTLRFVQQCHRYLNIQPTDCSVFTHTQTSWSMLQFFRILLRFQRQVKGYTQIPHYNFDYRLPKNSQITNFMKISPVGAELLNADGRTDGRTDMTKLIVAFRNFA
jgi:hypothetical protein